MPIGKNYLAIDTSGGYLSVVAAKDGAHASVFEADGALQHSVRLMDAVDEVLRALNARPNDFDFYSAVTGPGSFTGIRIGISTVKGFCAATGKPALGRTSFQVLAYNAEGKVLAAVPAGRGNYYVCGYDAEKRVCLAPSFIGEAELVRLSEEYRVVAYEPMPVACERADPIAGLIASVEGASEAEFGAIGAYYLKKSQAEEAREAKN